MYRFGTNLGSFSFFKHSTSDFSVAVKKWAGHVKTAEVGGKRHLPAYAANAHHEKMKKSSL